MTRPNVPGILQSLILTVFLTGIPAGCGTGSGGDGDTTPDGDTAPDGDIAVCDPATVCTGARLTKGPYVSFVAPDAISVNWETDIECGTCLVWEGEPGPPARTVAGTTHKLRSETSLEDPFAADPPDGFHHAAVIPDLAPGTAIRYTIGVPGAIAIPVATAPDPAGEFVVAAYGDTRTDHEKHRMVVADLLSAGPDLVLNSGDLLETGLLHSDWQGYFDDVAELAAGRLIAPAIGNHEAFGGMALFNGYFGDLIRRPDDLMIAYQLRFGSLQLLVLNSQADLFPGSPQYQWLAGEIEASHADPDIAWRVVMLHAPLYTWSNHEPKDTYDAQEREGLLALIGSAGIDLVLAGHNHCYEHFLVEGVHHLTLGGGGAPLYGTSSHVVPGEEQAGLRLVSAKVYHYSIWNVTPERIELVVRDADSDAEIDRFSLEFSSR